MTDRRRTISSPTEECSPLVRFRAEVARLSSLTAEDFAALDPDTSPPLVATIRATSRGVPLS